MQRLDARGVSCSSGLNRDWYTDRGEYSTAHPSLLVDTGAHCRGASVVWLSEYLLQSEQTSSSTEFSSLLFLTSVVHKQNGFMDSFFSFFRSEESS
jgi:hypothetical protein